MARPLSVLVFAILLALSTNALAQDAQCFPTCRDGFVCSPTGECVSECNPPCSSGQTCESGACVEPKESSEESSTGFRIDLSGGGFAQWFWDEHTGSQTGAGLDIRVAIFPGLGGFFVRPHLRAQWWDDDGLQGFGLDLGYELTGTFGGRAVGLQLALEPMVFRNAPLSGGGADAYVGASAYPFIRFGKTSAGLFVDYGKHLSFDNDVSALSLGVSFGYQL